MFYQKISSSHLLLCFLVAMLCIPSTVLAQSAEQQESLTYCERVLEQVSQLKGLNFGDTPCETNVYPKSFWVCVEKEVQSSIEFHTAVMLCEIEGGFN